MVEGYFFSVARPQEEHQRERGEHEYRRSPERITEGDHGSLYVHAGVEQLECPLLRFRCVKSLRHETRGQYADALDRLRRPKGELLQQDRSVERLSLRKQCRKQRDADTASELPSEVEETCCSRNVF